MTTSLYPTTVTTVNNFGPVQDIDLDSATGYPHIAYYDGGHIYHKYWTGAEWSVPTNLNPDAGTYGHIYQDEIGSIKIITSRSGNGHIWVVVNTGTIDFHPSTGTVGGIYYCHYRPLDGWTSFNLIISRFYWPDLLGTGHDHEWYLDIGSQSLSWIDDLAMPYLTFVRDEGTDNSGNGSPGTYYHRLVSCTWDYNTRAFSVGWWEDFTGLIFPWRRQVSVTNSPRSYYEYQLAWDYCTNHQTLRRTILGEHILTNITYREKTGVGASWLGVTGAFTLGMDAAIPGAPASKFYNEGGLDLFIKTYTDRPYILYPSPVSGVQVDRMTTHNTSISINIPLTSSSFCFNSICLNKETDQPIVLCFDHNTTKIHVARFSNHTAGTYELLHVATSAISSTGQKKICAMPTGGMFRFTYGHFGSSKKSYIATYLGNPCGKCTILSGDQKYIYSYDTDDYKYSDSGTKSLFIQHTNDARLISSVYVNGSNAATKDPDAHSLMYVADGTYRLLATNNGVETFNP